jgi:hypothetical protein
LAHQRSSMDAHWDNRHKGMQKIRSFIAYRCHDGKELPFLSFKLLRVLDLEAVYMESWHNAKHLGNLLHLRYLRLKGTNMPELPKEIGALRFLQTLDLVENFFKEELPSTIGMLTQLVCLRVCGWTQWGTSVPSGVIEKLTSLEELQLLVQCDVDELDDSLFDMNELGSLSELRALTIRAIEINQSMLSDLLQSVAKLHKVQSLKLENQSHLWNGLYDATFDAAALPRHLEHLLVSENCFRFSELPSCIDPSRLIRLSHLELYVIDMDEQGMRTLGRLPELRHLVLATESTVTVTNIATDGCFQKLRSCRFMHSMVLLALNADDCSVSFTLWNGRDDVPFGSRGEEDERRRAPPPPVMPTLEEISFQVHAEWCLTKREDGSYGSLGLEHIASLQRVVVTIVCEGYVFELDLTETEAELIHAINVHPNNPTLTWTVLNEGIIRSYTVRTRPDASHIYIYIYIYITLFEFSSI